MTKALKTIIFHTAATFVSTPLPRGDLEFGDWLRRALDCFNSRVIHQGTDYSCCDCPLLLSLRSHKCAVLSVGVFRARRVPSPCRVAGCLPFPVPPAVGSTCLCLFKASARAARCRNLLTFRLFSRSLSERVLNEQGLWVCFVQFSISFGLWLFLWSRGKVRLYFSLLYILNRLDLDRNAIDSLSVWGM